MKEVHYTLNKKVVMNVTRGENNGKKHKHNGASKAVRRQEYLKYKNNKPKE